MKYQNYIVEGEQGLYYFLPKIMKECKPFLRDIKGAAGTLFRDDTKNNNKPVWKKVTRTNRRPLDTSSHIHSDVDDWFLEKFGWRARSNVLFCWPLRFTSNWTTGKWLVFPAGDYKYVWSNQVDDLWSSINDLNYKTIGDEDEIDYFIKHFAKTYTDKNIKMAMKFQGEVMVNCKYSYLVKYELIENVNEALNLNWQGAKFFGRKI